ncbi:tropomyosin, partial [Nitriliruptoraceae bacterium ZYF776]|nr:tropomyosin [Profundirhabdus halotolerans]
AERKILDLEDELRIVGNNMKSLEISEQEAAQREEAYEENIRDLTERLKAAEDRAQDAERLVHTLQGETDRLEDELVAEKEKYKALAEELEQTFAELTGN